MKHNPITDCYPLMSGDEYKELVEDIKRNGLLYPVTTYNGELLDGRNRTAACRDAGIELRTEEYTGDDPIGFIVSTNKRRNLDASQRGMVAAKIANIKNGGDRRSEQSANLQTENISVCNAAKVMNVSERTVHSARAILEADPDLAEKVADGKLKVNAAEKQIRQKKKDSDRKEAVKAVSVSAKKRIEDVCDIRHCSMRELFESGIKPDAVITDPPYPKEFLYLYEELAQLTKYVPLVAAMCGQMFLPEILQMMTKHLQYRWTIAYLLPGGQSARVWPRKVNPFWKPVLLFGDAVQWIGDVAKSDTNDNDKEHHHWGQSESGMADLIERLTLPNQLVCDPFLGGGTTALVCKELGRRFVGCDIDLDAVEISRERVLV
jgi:hypothetical protein